MSETGGQVSDRAAFVPDAGGEEALAYGRWLFAQECRFLTGAVRFEAVPAPSLSEVAFVGRSNVGKSSLVNALTGRNTLARVSHTPGRTKELNFFELGGMLVLADLPGYGYARASKGRVNAWTRVVRTYLRGRPTLRRLCLLIDGRHGPKPADEDMMDMLDSCAVSYQVVLTKCDKVRDPELAARIDSMRQGLGRRPAAHPETWPVSVRTGLGIDALRAEIGSLAAPDQFGYIPPP